MARQPTLLAPNWTGAGNLPSRIQRYSVVFLTPTQSSTPISRRILRAIFCSKNGLFRKKGEIGSNKPRRTIKVRAQRSLRKTHKVTLQSYFARRAARGIIRSNKSCAFPRRGGSCRSSSYGTGSQAKKSPVGCVGSTPPAPSRQRDEICSMIEHSPPFPLASPTDS